MAATFFGFLGGAMTYLPMYDIPIPQYGIFLMPLYPFLMAYFMMRKHLFSDEDLAAAAYRDKIAAIGIISASINHEIRNPLYVIQGLAETWIDAAKNRSETKPAGPAEETLQKIIAQTHRAVDTMKKFAAFAQVKVSAEQTVAAVSLRQVLENIMPLIRAELRDDRIALVADIPDTLPPIAACRSQIEEIFFNLIVNAIQVMKEAGTGSEIVIRAIEDTGAVRVTLADNGPGMADEYTAKIFQPFYTTRKEGTGLGLYVTKHLVEKNGGEISVVSAPNRGTTFVLEFKKHSLPLK